MLKPHVLIVCVIFALLSGSLFDVFFGVRADFWIHDIAVVARHRDAWHYTGVVILDEKVPYYVGRKQALPLFALATDRLIQAGVKGIYMDARVSKEMETKMAYAVCIEPDGEVRWSLPECQINGLQQCQISNSEAGNAPLKMQPDSIARFRMAPFLGQHENLPDFLLFDWEAAMAIPEQGVVASDRLVVDRDPIGRWLDLSSDHAVSALIQLGYPEQFSSLLAPQRDDLICDEQHPCRRIRLSIPQFEVHKTGSKPILPVSELASCDEQQGKAAALSLKDKLVILQLTAPNEATDILVTPMTTALFGPRLMTPGAQFLIDSVETIMNQDAPIQPPQSLKYILFVVLALTGVFGAVYLSHTGLFLLGIVVVILLAALCFSHPVVQLWPFAAGLIIFSTGTIQVLMLKLLTGEREGRLIHRYLPEQIYSLLIHLRSNESFKARRCHVVVLMSDLAGYTTVTGLLKQPDLILEFMNDYLQQTSFVLQNRFNGILEAYVGDMFCYYWMDNNEEQRDELYGKAMQGAMELHRLQQQFFMNFRQRYQNRVDAEALEKIQQIVDAGIGITAGSVVMGDMGPELGIKKFGILGDPLNLAARIESLTRLFNADIIIPENLTDAAEAHGFVCRRLGNIKVKGRVMPIQLYALGCETEDRFALEAVAQWHTWLDDIERTGSSTAFCPELFNLDQQTLLFWCNKGLLRQGVWYLDEK